MTTPTKTKYTMSNWCTEGNRQDGLAPGGEPGTRDWRHRKCLGATRTPTPIKDLKGNVVGSEDTVTPCACSCHGYPAAVRCLDCGTTGEGEVDAKSWTCFDSASCELRVDERKSANPLVQQLRDCREAGERARAETRLRRERNGERMTETIEGAAPTTAPKQPRERKPARPKEGKCHHCGDATKGGLFVAGHDAKLKGELQRVAADPGQKDKARVSAIAEQLARGWHKRPVPDPVFKHAKGENDEAKAKSRNDLEQHYVALRTQAEQLVEQHGKDGVIEKAVKARLASNASASAS